MKKLLFALLCGVLALSFIACDDEDEKVTEDTKIYINGKEHANKSLQERMSVHEVIMNDSVVLGFRSNEFTIWGVTMSFAEGNIDTEKDRFMLKVGNIQRIVGNSFFTASEVFIYDNHSQGHNDTLAYVPNAQRAEAYERILEIWDDETKKDEIFDIFTNAFNFIPCTGAEYKYLVENGLN